MAANDNRLAPPPFWRTRYFEAKVMARPDRQEIDLDDVKRALEHPIYRSVQPDGRFRHWVWVEQHQRWLRVVIEADGETVHNTFFDRNFKP